MWQEGVGKIGDINIATCLWKYMSNQCHAGSTEFSLFSDSCGEQNKNKTMAATSHHIVRSLKVDVITHYFLEKGRTQNESESVHSVIECATKRTNIYEPSQWYTLVALAHTENEHTKW